MQQIDRMPGLFGSLGYYDDNLLQISWAFLRFMAPTRLPNVLLTYESFKV
jgi:hypothetical protein